MENERERVAIIAPYTSLHGEDKSNRFRSLAVLLARKRSVCLVTSKFDHTRKRMRILDESNSNDVPYDVELIWEPGYGANVSLSRVISHFVFLIGLVRWLLRRGSDYDKFICAAPFSLTTIICKALLRKKVIIDVQDVWPEAFFLLTKNSFVKRLLESTKIIPKIALRKADAIITVSNEFSARCSKLANGRPTATIYIGSEVSEKLKRSCDISLESAEKIKIVYIGTVGSNYDIRRVARVFNDFQGFRKWELYVVGDGPLLPEMVREFRDCPQIIFMGSYPFEEMVRIMNNCHFAINPIMAESSITVTNKVSDYFAIGIPFISGQNSPEVQQLVSKVDPHLCYEAGNSESLRGVMHWIDRMTDSEYRELHTRIREIGDEFFMRASSYLTYERIVNEL